MRVMPPRLGPDESRRSARRTGHGGGRAGAARRPGRRPRRGLGLAGHPSVPASSCAGVAASLDGCSPAGKHPSLGSAVSGGGPAGRFAMAVRGRPVRDSLLDELFLTGVRLALEDPNVTWFIWVAGLQPGAVLYLVIVLTVTIARLSSTAGRGGKPAVPGVRPDARRAGDRVHTRTAYRRGNHDGPDCALDSSGLAAAGPEQLTRAAEHAIVRGKCDERSDRQATGGRGAGLAG